MNLRIEIDEQETSVVLNSITITKELSGRNSSATFTLAMPDAIPDAAQQAEVIIFNDDTGAKVFRGFITATSIDQKSGTLQMWQVTCTGIEFILENVTINQTWTGKTDRQIIQEAFAAVLPEITTDNSTVAALTGAIDFEAKDSTLRELLERLAAVAGAEWRITEEKALSWRAVGSVAAPFGFSDAPNAGI